jgi:transposase
MPTQEAYPSSLSEAQWKWIEPLVPGPKLFGRPPRYTKRAILDAIFYVVRGGIAWRLLPHDLPPWRIVYYYFMIWRRDGLGSQIHDALRDRVRLQSGKKKPRPLRSSTRRALKYLTTAECAATMQARRSWDESDTSWSIRWV